MRLKLEQLQGVVKSAIREKKALDRLKLEAKRALGPIIDTSLGLRDFAECVNERLGVLERTGRPFASFDPRVVAVFSHHNDPTVRKMAANLLPEDQLSKFTGDKNNAVRAVVAKRVGLTTVREMMRAFPTDEELRLIYRKRVHARKNLLEGEEFDIHGDEPIGDSGKTWEGVELSEDWYRTKAQDLLNDYAKNDSLDNHWEERAIVNFCEHTRVTSGVEIDKKKLFDALKDLVKEREDHLLNTPHMHLRLYEGAYNVEPQPGGTFNVVDDSGTIVDSGFHSAAEAQAAATAFEDELNAHYDSQASAYEDELDGMYDAPANDMKPRMESVLGACVRNLLNESDDYLLPEFREESDPMRDLAESGLSGTAFLSQAKKLLKVQESTVPAALKKHVLGEGSRTRLIPVKARLPHTKGIRPVDEKTLDMFVEAWNAAQVTEGEPYKLYWNVDPCDVNSIGFNLILR